jgi:hypothetical protein
MDNRRARQKLRPISLRVVGYSVTLRWSIGRPYSKIKHFWFLRYSKSCNRQRKLLFHVQGFKNTHELSTDWYLHRMSASLNSLTINFCSLLSQGFVPYESSAWPAELPIPAIVHEEISTAKVQQVHSHKHKFPLVFVIFLTAASPSFNSFKREGQCAYNVTLWPDRESLLPWKSNKRYLLVCVCKRARACVHVGSRARGLVHAHKCM